MAYDETGRYFAEAEPARGKAAREAQEKLERKAAEAEKADKHNK